MDLNDWDEKARGLIEPDSDLVAWHLDYLKEMVRIDSRSFGVNEFEGDRKTPSDMKEILGLAEKYLKEIGFTWVKINEPPSGSVWTNPILMAEIAVAKGKPTLLFYAHLDKQPYMDNEKFEKWGGVSPTQLRWNKDKTRAYGRGAADDLAGVTSIGLAVDSLLRSIGYDSQNPSPQKLALLPCNIKVIYETEEESGSHSLIDQIRQNHDFFAPSDCVVITDVINPAQGHPGLTTSLRGIIQCEVEMIGQGGAGGMDSQTALYKLLATLIHDDHSLAVAAIADADVPLTEEETKGYSLVPTSVEFLRETAGLLPATRLTVPSDKAALVEAQLRKSYANVRPGHRVSGSIIFGAAGVRLSFKTRKDFPGDRLKSLLEKNLNPCNRFNLKLTLQEAADDGTAYDLVLQSSTKDPHSGINGGPFPVAELQVAKMVDHLIGNDGRLNLEDGGELMEVSEDGAAVKVESLFVDHDGAAHPFNEPVAKAIVEIRLAPGNEEETARQHLNAYLRERVLPGFDLKITEDKGASPWITGISHPVFPIILESLEVGYKEKACLYGCGGSIPFVPKLVGALGEILPLCLGAYDPDARMHEPGESLSMVDWLGCARSIVRFLTRAPGAFPNPKGR